MSWYRKKMIEITELLDWNKKKINLNPPKLKKNKHQVLELRKNNAQGVRPHETTMRTQPGGEQPSSWNRPNFTTHRNLDELHQPLPPPIPTQTSTKHLEPNKTQWEPRNARATQWPPAVETPRSAVFWRSPLARLMRGRCHWFFSRGRNGGERGDFGASCEVTEPSSALKCPHWVHLGLRVPFHSSNEVKFSY